MRNKNISNDGKLKVGIIGCGKMGKHHMRAVVLQENAEIVAVADPFVEQRELVGLVSSNTKIYSSAEELLLEASLDVVHIVTPPETHSKLAQLALENGVHIYVEKPFTFNRSEAEAIYSLAEAEGLRVCAGHQVLFENPAILAQKCLDEIGKLIHVESYFSFRTVRRNITPVEQLIDILPHPVCLLLSFLEYSSESSIEFDTIAVSPEGEVRAMVKSGTIYGSLNVSLQGRPIESYVRLIGTNGSLFADFVRGTVIKLPGPGASAVSVVFNTYSQAFQCFWKSTKFFAGMAFKKHKSYPGLAEIIKVYYSSISDNSSFPVPSTSTISTVSLCEAIYDRLKQSELEFEENMKCELAIKAKKLLPLSSDSEVVLVTGGTGFLGGKAAQELRKVGYRVRILARNIPPFSKQLPGVEYAFADLGDSVPEVVFTGVTTIVHCAAETSGGEKEHERNTIQATKNLLNAAANTGVKHFVNISSIAVIKTSKEVGGPLDETTPLDIDNKSRGPYVWGKAKAERLADELGTKLGIRVKTIRLGPLVDFNSFTAPGRLGKEVGLLFVAVGSKKSTLSVCDVHTAAKVIRHYVADFQEVPRILNLVEATPPTREKLVCLLKKNRKELKCIWLPMFILNLASPFLKLLQRILLSGRKPIDIVAVFSTEPYNTNLATGVISKAKQGI